jgi:hypothetical protein
MSVSDGRRVVLADAGDLATSDRRRAPRRRALHLAKAEASGGDHSVTIRRCAHSRPRGRATLLHFDAWRLRQLNKSIFACRPLRA